MNQLRWHSSSSRSPSSEDHGSEPPTTVPATTTSAKEEPRRLRLQRIPPDLEGVSLTFVDPMVLQARKQAQQSGIRRDIEALAQRLPTIACLAVWELRLSEDTKYTVGLPCDTAVTICKLPHPDPFYDPKKDDPLRPPPGPNPFATHEQFQKGINKNREAAFDGTMMAIEADWHDLMDDIFPVAQRAVQRHYYPDEKEGDPDAKHDPLSPRIQLLRTPQTLTLTGELPNDNDDGSDENEGPRPPTIDWNKTRMTQEELEEFEKEEHAVTVLLDFVHRGLPFAIVKYTEPVMIVGKEHDKLKKHQRLLLQPKESAKVMPLFNMAEMDDIPMEELRTMEAEVQAQHAKSTASEEEVERLQKRYPEDAQE